MLSEDSVTVHFYIVGLFTTWFEFVQFLYRGQALYEWLSSSQVPKSPETRAMVLPTDVYRLS
jgi:hypothetical protein